MQLLARIGDELSVLLLAASPVIELRGAVPLAMALGLSMQEAFFFAFVGNMLPIPLVILLTRKLIALLKRQPFCASWGQWMETHAIRSQKLVTKYSLPGLALLVAIPLPGTGAWTGAMLASLLGLRQRQALPAIAAGVLIADLLVTGVTYHLFG